jgi:hypothetical protein
MFERFEAEVPPDITDPAERARCAARLITAHMQLLAMRSSQARRKKTTS